MTLKSINKSDADDFITSYWYFQYIGYVYNDLLLAHNVFILIYYQSQLVDSNMNCCLVRNFEYKTLKATFDVFSHIYSTFTKQKKKQLFFRYINFKQKYNTFFLEYKSIKRWSCLFSTFNARINLLSL